MADVHEVLKATDKSKFHWQIKTYWSDGARDKNRMNVSKLTSKSLRCLSIETWMPRWKGT